MPEQNSFQSLDDESIPDHEHLLANEPAESCDQEIELEPPIFSDESIRQQTTRSWVDGADCLSVSARVVIPAGADREVVHIPIQPAFATVPDVEAFVISGADMRIRVTHRQKFGLRLELVLAKPSSEAAESIIEIVSLSKQKETTCQLRQEAA
jgi:hypothetical protein